MTFIYQAPVSKGTHPRRPADALAILRIAMNSEPAMQRLFIRAVAAVRNGTVLTRVREAIERGDLPGAYAAIPWEEIGEPVLRNALPAQLREIYEGAANVTARRLSSELGIEIRFDVTNPRAVDYIRRRAADMIREFGQSNQDTIRGIIERSFREGIDPYKTARIIRDSGIGLTERMTLAVQRYRGRLAEAGELNAGQVETRAQRYADRLLRLRSQNIARTETISASNRGQNELWREAQEAGLVPRDAQREWIVAADDRLCPICEELDGKTAPIDGLFPGGFDGPPAHVACRCATGLTFKQ